MFFSSSSKDPEPPNRSSRAKCWSSRDNYFGCLQSHHQQQIAQNSNTKPYYVPGTEPAEICQTERDNYHSSCMKSWVDHFNRLVVNEQRSAATQLNLSASFK
ncbi:hypothetical protein O181_095827 [Austropuccinia psidii MF-1]|uniref:Uncharacterized protein n=1 Tax=Austropuccinia psidii MF-1 TaxID=1389203 RepID=A0A9Q3J649_9BASI|nr:hypothetical protein [Austropuccinia psidii MF-1]